MTYLCSDKMKNNMKRKTIGIIVVVLVLAFAGGIGWQHRNSAQTRLLRAAEDIVFTDVDSTADGKFTDAL